MAFYRLLATMVNAGLTVLQGTENPLCRTENPVMKKIEEAMIKNIQSGHNLSSTLRAFLKSFSDSEIAMRGRVR